MPEHPRKTGALHVSAIPADFPKQYTCFFFTFSRFRFTIHLSFFFLLTISGCINAFSYNRIRQKTACPMESGTVFCLSEIHGLCFPSASRLYGLRLYGLPLR